MNKLLLLLGITLVLSSCGSKNKSKNITNKFLVTSPILIDTNYITEYVADIHSIQNVEIRTKVKGHLENIFVDEGSAVKSGQILFSINKDAFNLELLRAQSKLKSAIAELKIEKLELENVEKLFAKNIVSKTEIEKAEAMIDAANAKIDEAKSEVEAAKLNLSYTEIKAPFDGIIDRIPYKKGSIIDDGALLTTISNNKEVFAYFNVSEKEYLSIREQKASLEKDKITLLLADNNPHQYKGNIETIDGEFDKNTGNIAFRAKFYNPEILLRHGSSGKVQIQNKLKGALIIPQKSTFEIQDKYYVFVVNSNGNVSVKNINVKHKLPHLFAIDTNLKPSDKIIFEGIQNVKDGDKVVPEFMPLRQIILNFNKQ